MTSLRPGDKVIVDPSDEDDPQAREWVGRECAVLSTRKFDPFDDHGVSTYYVRVEHGRERMTFREKDLRKL